MHIYMIHQKHSLLYRLLLCLLSLAEAQMMNLRFDCRLPQELTSPSDDMSVPEVSSQAVDWIV